MFGYVKPYHPELLVKEYEFYKSVYCGVCRSMKKCTGALSNVLHSYDSVFLALVRMLYVPDSAIGAKKQRCIAHPLKKKNMLKRNDATDYTAKAFGILTYYKIIDDISDEKLMKKMATSLLRPIFASAKNRANMVNIAKVCHEKLSEINKLEKEKIASVDEPAKLFGELLGTVFSEGLDEENRLITYTLGFHLGKFIYAADAAEDYEKDKKRGRYNPYVEIYGGAELTYENRQTIKCALLLECKKLEGAVNLLPFGRRAIIENIINNIIYLGLPKRIEFLDRKDGGEEDGGKAELNE
ncbi:MAG: hypothetical protein E7673_04020 [Ruminococcaceae bacterium]|nr:hypothetical protein [Oscillospiraceae bacterium]